MSVDDGAGDHAEKRTSALAPPSGRTWFDIAVLLMLTLLGVLGFAPSFGGYSFLAAGIGGSRCWAPPPASSPRCSASGGLLTFLAAIVGYFLFGPAVAVPSQTIAGFIPTLQSLASLAIGTVYGWADLLTLSTPVGAPAYIAVVPYVATWVVALVSTLLATRWLAHRPRTAWRFAVAIAPAVRAVPRRHPARHRRGVPGGRPRGRVRGARARLARLARIRWAGSRPAVTARCAGASSLGTVAVVLVAVLVGGAAAFWLAPPPGPALRAA